MLNILCKVKKCCELKQHVLHVLHGTDKTDIDNTVAEWRGCLSACVWTKGDT